MSVAEHPIKYGQHGYVLFDRLNPEPPPYLYSLRNIGHWRRWKHAGTYRELSTALRNVQNDWTGNTYHLPKNRGCFLDAGCGHSSDAYFAMQRWRFEEGIKVDLFPPYETLPHFREQMEKFEQHKTRFIQGDICKLTDYVPRNSVDMIGCAAVLDLMDAADRGLFYSEAYEVLRPGGIMTIGYQWLVHGYHDWDFREQRTVEMSVGFDCLKWNESTLIVRKPE